MAGDGSTGASQVELVVVRPQDDELIAAAIALGNTARATLGHLPFAAYDAAADKGTLLVGRVNANVVGYALYGRSFRRIRLTHLCVDPAARGNGIARLLVDEISRSNANYLGIRVRCRHDYGLGPMWITLGFRQLSERPGRGREAQPLIDWWRDHGYVDLYAADADAVLVKAAIDMNILRNWLVPSRPRHLESIALLEDHLSDRLRLFRTQALDAEIDAINGELRRQCMAKVQPLGAAPRNPERYTGLQILLQAAADLIVPGYPRTTQDERDLRHVAAAIAGELNVFVTLDADLGKALGPEAARHGLSILHPADVIVRIDELARAEAYRPIDLENTRYSQRLLGAGEDYLVQSLANLADGERPRTILSAARNVAVAGGERVGIFNPTGELSGYYGLRDRQSVLDIDSLRVTDAYIGDTLVRQLLFNLRQTARGRGARVLSIDGDHLQPRVRAAAIHDGFREHDGRLVAFVLDAVGDADVVGRAATEAARAAGLEAPSWITSRMLAIPAAEVEQNWWPAKLVDSELPTYLIPIRQAYSSNLLGVPPVLIQRDDTLGLNREHVYYRRPGTQRLQAPARILWYMSLGGQSAAEQAGVIACSQLHAVHVSDPEELHDRFRHLGVWSLDDVVAAARDGQAQALQFTSTEVFPRTVTLRRMSELAENLSLSCTAPQSPRALPSELFAAIYREGFTS
ncbi:hypothetical protein GCM10009745_63540 [Kribbella yunnanensis]|uniref:N-acetyltransferase domain-containing protein n=1 Tax=Kribbella yunnanensis TaxID=190194 RepID=A0ABN2IKS6_9ACTN